jgi:hypothetical protein
MNTFLLNAATKRRWVWGALMGLGLALAGATAQAHVFGSISVTVPPVTMVWGNTPQAAVVYNGPVYANPVYSTPVYSSPVYTQAVYSAPVYSGPAFPHAQVIYGVPQSPYPPVVYPSHGHHEWHGHWGQHGMGGERHHGRHFD